MNKLERSYQIQISPNGTAWLDYETPSGLLITAEDIASFNSLPPYYRVRIVRIKIEKNVMCEMSAKDAQENYPWKGDEKCPTL